MNWYKKAGKDDFEKFLEKGAGWLTPANKLLVTDYWNHLEALKEEIEKNPNDYPSDLVAMLESHKDTLEDLRESVAQEVKETGAGWHVYDMTEDSLSDKFMTAIYDQGALIRVVLLEDKRVLKAEGSPKGIENHMANLKRLVDKINDIPYAVMTEGEEYHPYKLETQYWYTK